MQANSNITSHTQKRREEIRAKRILEVKDTTNKVAKKKKPEKIQPESSTICSYFSEKGSDDITKTKFCAIMGFVGI